MCPPKLSGGPRHYCTDELGYTHFPKIFAEKKTVISIRETGRPGFAPTRAHARVTTRTHARTNTHTHTTLARTIHYQAFTWSLGISCAVASIKSWNSELDTLHSDWLEIPALNFNHMSLQSFLWKKKGKKLIYYPAGRHFCCCFCCFMSTVNSCDHVGRVQST